MPRCARACLQRHGHIPSTPCCCSDGSSLPQSQGLPVTRVSTVKMQERLKCIIYWPTAPSKQQNDIFIKQMQYKERVSMGTNSITSQLCLTINVNTTITTTTLRIKQQFFNLNPMISDLFHCKRPQIRHILNLMLIHYLSNDWSSLAQHNHRVSWQSNKLSVIPCTTIT